MPFFEELSIDELQLSLPRSVVSSLSRETLIHARTEADRQVDLARDAGARILSSVDPDYPTLLRQTRDDPQILFVQGRFASSPEKSVAIVGTREPTEHGRVIAERLTRFFIQDGWSVVSGLAIGCDAIAHDVALSEGGHTVAVLAHGLQTISPARHKKLAERILASGGALVTEYHIGQDALPAQFAKRDRTQAGLAQGVVMIQSDVKGGSLFASRAALDYDRWLAVPYPTEQDVLRREPKVQANILMADGTIGDRSDLLKCEPGRLKNLVILRGRSDYAKMLRPLSRSVPSIETPPAQGQLF